MAVSRYHALTVALAAALTNRAGLSGVPVYDGPSVVRGSHQQAITIGWTNDPRDTESGDARQDWATDGGADAGRNETVRVRCTLIAADGGSDIPATRARAWTYLAEVEDTLRDAYSLGVEGVMWAHIVDMRIYQDLTDGAYVEVRFTVEAQARI